MEVFFSTLDSASVSYWDVHFKYYFVRPQGPAALIFNKTLPTPHRQDPDIRKSSLLFVISPQLEVLGIKLVTVSFI